MRVLLVACLVASAVAVSHELFAAREAYASRQMQAITASVSEMIHSAGLDKSAARHQLLAEWNATTSTDVGGLHLLSRAETSELAGLFTSFVAQEAAFLGHVVDTVFASQTTPLPVSYAHAVVGNCDKLHAGIKTSGERVRKVAGGKVVEAGGGFGFGFQIFCGCKLLATSGGGFGSGMTVTAVQGVAGGLGGGGGVQLFKGGAQDAGKDDKPALNVGGGGGGDLNGCAGSTDFGQVHPVSYMHEAKDSILQQQINECPEGDLSIVGGGGGGMGFTVTHTNNTTDPNATAPVSAYGGGLNLKFQNADAAANDKKCGGKLLEESASSGPGNYTAIDKATSKCRAQCQAAKSAGLSKFWECTCPCTQTEFQKLNLTFAAKMKC